MDGPLPLVEVPEGDDGTNRSTSTSAGKPLLNAPRNLFSSPAEFRSAKRFVFLDEIAKALDVTRRAVTASVPKASPGGESTSGTLEQRYLHRRLALKQDHHLGVDA